MPLNVYVQNLFHAKYQDKIYIRPLDEMGTADEN
jgi:hypothetical protein